MTVTYREISPGFREGHFSMKVTLKLKPACGADFLGWEELMPAGMRRVREEGGGA